MSTAMPSWPAAGIDDPRPEALAYMARVGYPGSYDPEAPCLGVPADDFALLEAYYDRGAEVMAGLGRLGAVRMEAAWTAWDGRMFPDYYEFPENRAVRGRGIQPVLPEGGAGNGGELVLQLADFAACRGVTIRLGHRVVELVTDGRRVVGVAVDDGSATRTVLARRGVVFGSGGFAHNGELRRRFLRGPIAGGSGTPSNTGDLIAMAPAAGAQLGRMHSGWWSQQVLEAVDDYATSVLDIWSIPGDGMVLVNRFGVRAVDEKREYESRGRVHHVYQGDEYVNRVMFMVYDRRTAERFGGRYPIPPAGAVADHVVTGTGVAGLTRALGRPARGPRPCGHAGRHRPRRAWRPASQSALSRHPVPVQRHGRVRPRRRVRAGNQGGRAGLPRSGRIGQPPAQPADASPRRRRGAARHRRGGHHLRHQQRAAGRRHRPGARRTGTDRGALRVPATASTSVFGEGYPGGGSTIGPGMVFGYLAGKHAAGRPAAAGSAR